MIKRHTTYCFEAKMKEIGKDTYYFVPFQVLAENQYVAKTILEEYLKNPEQTGWRYEACVNLMPIPTLIALILINILQNAVRKK